MLYAPIKAIIRHIFHAIYLYNSQQENCDIKIFFIVAFVPPLLSHDTK